MNRRLSLQTAIAVLAGSAGLVGLAGLAGSTGSAVVAQRGIAPAGDQPAGPNWTYPSGDQGATRFSTLNQITAANVATLERAWTFKTGSARFAGAPMVIDSVMYFSAPNGVYAVDAVTGTLIWKYSPAPPPTAPATAPT